jgi:hypothetical protein
MHRLLLALYVLAVAVGISAGAARPALAGVAVAGLVGAHELAAVRTRREVGADKAQPGAWTR